MASPHLGREVQALRPLVTTEALARLSVTPPSLGALSGGGGLSGGM